MIEAAERARLGGGRNIGMQRSAPAQQQAAPKAPAQQQQQQAAPATPAQQPQPAGASKWLGPLAGLALGAGLAALFFNNGMSGLLAGLLLIGLLVAAVVFAARFLLRGRVAQQPLQYAGAGAASAAARRAARRRRRAFCAATTSRWPLGVRRGRVRAARQAQLRAAAGSPRQERPLDDARFPRARPLSRDRSRHPCRGRCAATRPKC